MANNASTNNKGGKNKKYGRMRSACAAYRQARKDSINQRNRMLRTLRHHPDNAQLAADLMKNHNVPKATIEGIIKRAQAKATTKLVRTVVYDDSTGAVAKMRADVERKLRDKQRRKAEAAAQYEACIPTMGRAIIDAQRDRLGLPPRFGS